VKSLGILLEKYIIHHEDIKEFTMDYIKSKITDKNDTNIKQFTKKKKSYLCH